MPAKKHTSTKARLLAQPHLLGIATLCVAASFAMGIRSAGDVETIEPLEASTAQTVGDMNSDGIADARDAAVILEIALHYRTAETWQLKADPNQDGQLTVEDALQILHDAAL